MKKKLSRMSRSSVALLGAAFVLLGAGTFAAGLSANFVRSDLYRASFYLNHLQVHLIENGKDVCTRAGHTNDLDGGSKTTGELATELGYEHKTGSDETLGSIEPGKLYTEEIAAQNGSDIDEFVRLTVRKYWMEREKDSDGKTIEDGTLTRSTTLRPDRIRLYFGGSEGYNSSAWTMNPAESTDESNTYYYNSVLGDGDTTALLFDQIMIDKEIKDLGETLVSTTKEGNKTIYTYQYQYDDCVFYIEADVQAIQTHNINEAIKSQWGVSNVTGTYDDQSGTGSLSVN